MSQVISLSAALVNGTNKCFAPQEEENFAVKGGRVFARAVADTVLTPIALIETVVFAVLTAATFICKATNLTKPVFDWANEHRSVAANATKNALAGIIGRGVVAAPKGKKEIAKEKVEAFIAQAKNFASNNIERKHVIGAVGLAAIALTAFFFGGTIASGIASVASTGYNWSSWAVGAVTGGAVSAASTGWSWTTWSAETVKDGAVSATKGVYSYTLGIPVNYFFPETSTTV